MKKNSTIGMGIKMPKDKCEDDNCPFHGSLKIRGKHFTGIVVGSKMAKTVTVEWLHWKNIPKYERKEKKVTKIKVHNPPCINAQVGDKVLIYECRPLSKTKNFVVVQKLGKDIMTEERLEAKRESKSITKKKEPVNEIKPETKKEAKE